MSGPRHRLATVALVTNADGSVLLVDGGRRGWELPGGEVEEGESLVDGCAREVLEETGVAIEVERLAAVYSNLRPTAGLVFGFLCRPTGGEPTPSEETRAVEWVPRAGVLARVTRQATRDRIAELLAFDGAVLYRAYDGEPYRSGTSRRI